MRKTSKKDHDTQVLLAEYVSSVTDLILSTNVYNARDVVKLMKRNLYTLEKDLNKTLYYTEY